MPPATAVPSASAAYGALQAYQAPSATDVLSQANQQAGLPQAQTRVSDLQSAVNNLNTSLNAVDPSVTGRTAGTFTTEGQRAALVTKEQAPIQQNLTSENANLGQAATAEGQAESQANSLASAIMTQNQGTYQKLLDQYNAAAAYEKQQQDQANAQAQLQQSASQFSQTQNLNEQQLAEKSQADQVANQKAQAAQYSVKYKGDAYDAAGNLTKQGDASQGYDFIGPGGAPVSMAQFIQGSGGGSAQVLQLLQNGTSYDKNVYNKVKNLTGDALQNALKKYPVYGF